MSKSKFRQLKQNRTILTEKLKESLSSVLPVTGIVFLLCFSVSPVPNKVGAVRRAPCLQLYLTAARAGVQFPACINF